MASSQGQSIRFAEDDVRPMGRSARGVIGMRLEGEDAVVEMDCLKPDGGRMLTVTGRYAKRTEIEEYRLRARRLRHHQPQGQRQDRPVVQVMQVTDREPGVVITSFGKIIRTAVRGISVLGRPTQGCASSTSRRATRWSPWRASPRARRYPEGGSPPGGGARTAAMRGRWRPGGAAAPRARPTAEPGADDPKGTV